MHLQPVELPGKPNGEVTNIDHFLHFPQAFLQALAHLVAHQRPQRIFVLTQLIAILAYNFPALWGWQFSPYIKRCLRRLFTRL